MKRTSSSTASPSVQQTSEELFARSVEQLHHLYQNKKLLQQQYQTMQREQSIQKSSSSSSSSSSTNKRQKPNTSTSSSSPALSSMQQHILGDVEFTRWLQQKIETQLQQQYPTTQQEQSIQKSSSSSSSSSSSTHKQQDSCIPFLLPLQPALEILRAVLLAENVIKHRARKGICNDSCRCNLNRKEQNKALTFTNHGPDTLGYHELAKVLQNSSLSKHEMKAFTNKAFSSNQSVLIGKSSFCVWRICCSKSL